MSVSCLTGVQVGAEENDTFVVKGKISGLQEVPEGTKRVVFDGCKGESGESSIYLPEGVIVEIKDGTENKIGSFESAGTVNITGDGTLYFDQIEVRQGDLIIDSGVLNGGYIITDYGNITINGGDVSVIDKDLGILSLGGSVEMTGGDVSVITQGEAIAGVLEHGKEGQGVILNDAMKEKGYYIEVEVDDNGYEKYILTAENGKSVMRTTLELDGDGMPERNDIVNDDKSGGSSAVKIILLLAVLIVIMIAAFIIKNHNGRALRRRR